ncbi:MAG: hypothetical protein JRI23_29210 [Deltaproteobacteria bacterium]|jgi:hypothetical protein|nr:hypothetical protein [Deltaproteobacteria bacterium]MBW2536218.1 hypothetical protein [Deltaproteobacteria bacterium]
MLGSERARVACLGAAALVGLSGCAGDWNDPIGTDRAGLAHPGPWVIPDDVLTIGDTQYVEYTGAGPWVGPSGCSGGLTPGAAILREYLYAHFPQTPHIGGYACRPINNENSADQMSVHGTGRALDVMIPLDGDDADNDLGDPVANFLVVNAEAIGIQYIIWDRWSWRADREPGSKGRAYTGTIPHLDHPHVEISVAASEHTEMWFADSVTPPAIEGCDPIPPQGAIVDDLSPCFRAMGPAEYWRTEEGVGYDGQLRWTNAFESDEPSNWARYDLTFLQAGSYELEVFLDPAFAVAAGVLYEIAAGSELYQVEVDQSAANGWLSLGTFDFAAGGMQQVDVFDHQPAPVPEDQHIAVDAIRLTGEGQPPPDDPGNPLAPFPAGTPNPSDPSTWGVPGSNDGCSCRLETSRSGTNSTAVLGVWAWVLLALARRGRG